MREYTVLAVLSVLGTVGLEVVWLRTGIFRTAQYWIAMGIVRGHWSYSDRYTTGILLPLDVPLEELVFFVVIPVCGLLTYEAVGTVLGWVRQWRGRDA